MRLRGTVFVVDDDEEMRRSLKRMLESVKLPVQAFSTAREFLEAFEPASRGCLVLDVRMPGMSGMELQNRLVARGITVPIIFITAHGDIPMSVEAMKKGAADFIVKPFRFQVLLDRIQQVLERDAEIAETDHERKVAAARLGLLTERERQVVDVALTGMSNKQIALQLGVSTQAIYAHRAKAMNKLQAASIPDLVKTMLFAETNHLVRSNDNIIMATTPVV